MAMGIHHVLIAWHEGGIQRSHLFYLVVIELSISVIFPSPMRLLSVRVSAGPWMQVERMVLHKDCCCRADPTLRRMVGHVGLVRLLRLVRLHAFVLL